MHVPTRHALRVDAVDRDLPAGDLVESHEQIHHRRLARAGGPHDRHFLPRLHVRREIVDDELVRLVPEFHVLEAHAAFDGRDLAVAAVAEQWLLVGLVGELGFVEEGEHPFGARGAALQILERLRELRERLREQANVEHERHDHAEFDRAVHRERRADHAHDDVAEVAHEVHHWQHEARDELALPSRVVQVVVVAFESADRIGLAAEGLDHGVPAVHLLHMAVHVAERHLLLDEVLLREPHHDEHEHHAEQGRAHCAQCQDPVVREHHDERAHEQRDRRDERAEGLPERLAHRVHVVRDAAHHVAGAVLVEVFERQLVHLHVDGRAQALRRALRDGGHHPALRV